MKNNFLLFILSLAFTSSYAQQIPDFTLTDLNGQEHSLYEDYLDNGMAVVINISATWSGPDWQWHTSGVLESFYQNYGGNGIQVLHLEGDGITTDDDLYGTGNQTQGNWVDGTSYPILNPATNDLVASWGLQFYPTMMIICPDGTAYADGLTAPFINQDQGVFYAEFPNSEALLDKITSLCGEIDLNLNEVVAQVYLDANNNCTYDAGEQFVPGFLGNVSGNGLDLNRISSQSGSMRWFVDAGTYDLTMQSPNTNWFFCNDAETLDFTGTEDSLHFYFGVQAVQDCYDPTVDISSPFLLRCFESDLYVTYCNEGTVTAPAATVEVTLDSMFIFLNANPAPTSINGHVLTFEVGDLDPFACGNIHIAVEVSCDAELGDVHCYSAQIFPTTNCDITAPITLAEECQENVGSYDPNDKRAWPKGVGATNDVLPNEELRYQVRFQNTGTFMAINVVVLDTLSENVDLASLRLGTSSHEYTFDILDERVLRWTYENIMLPDSNSNEPASHGFFNYTIKQQPDLLNGTTIENSAAIYFDFNEPVITNTYTHTINDMIVNVPVIPEQLDFKVFPNPNKRVFNVIIDEDDFGNGYYQLTDIHGKLLRTTQIPSSQFQIQHELLPGLYILKLINDDGKVAERKIVVQ